MEEIKEIVKFISRKKLRHIETFNLNGETEGVYREMYYLILKNKDITEDELAEKISKTKKTDKKFGMVKSRFKKRLFNHILFLDHSENSTEVNKVISSAYKKIYIAKLLQINSILKASYYMVKKALPTLKKYEILEPLLTAYQIELDYYTKKIKFKKVEFISNSLIKISKAIMIETEVLTLYEKSALLFSKSKVLNYRDSIKMDEIISSIKKLKDSEEILFKAKWTALVVLIEYAIYSGDFLTLNKRTTEVEKLLHQKPHFKFKIRQLFLLTWQLTIYGEKGEIKKGLETVKKLRTIFDSSNINWFYAERKILFYYTTIDDYAEAHKIAKDAIGKDNFKNINDEAQEMWILWNAYLTIINTNYNIKKLKGINIYKIINSFNKLSKEKIGLNILIISLEIFYKFLIEDFDRLIDISNSLSIYKSRYLKPNKLRRSQVFFNMIISAKKYGFDKKSFHETGTKAIEKLRKLKNTNPEKIAFEFIPYEKIIDIMINK